MALGPSVTSLSIAIAGGRGGFQALTFVPHNWSEMIKQDAAMRLAFMGSITHEATESQQRIGVVVKGSVGRAKQASPAEPVITVGSVLI